MNSTGETESSKATAVTNAMSDVNIARWVGERGAELPESAAIKEPGRVMTFAELDALVGRAATELTGRGVGEGDRVALIMPNVALFPVYYYAILRLGAVVVPMNPLLKAGEISFVWHDAKISVAVVFAAFAAGAETAADLTGTTIVPVSDETYARLDALTPLTTVTARGDDDTAVVLYTSGTTGTPKGAELTHHNLGSNVRTTLQTLFPMAPGDVIFGGLPLFHSFGQTVALNCAVASGACLTLLARFDPAVALRMVADDKVSIFMGVPTMYVALLSTPQTGQFSAPALRLAVSGGSSMPVEVLRGVEERFGLTLLEGYGLSETSPVASFNHPDRPSRPGSIGTPIRGCEFDLVDSEDRPVRSGDVGEIVIRGENVMKGYLNRPEDTAVAMRGGWFHTGDLGRRDEDGYYYIVDRLKDMILRGGLNVYPREVEEVLYTHPAVQEAAVVGIPHARLGEEVAALVTLKEGQQATEEELIGFVKDRIAAYKYPRFVRFGALPKGPTGKILKRSITIEP